MLRLFKKAICNVEFNLLMKFACELVVTDVLPAVRRELANELTNVYFLTQKDVAVLFGVTDAAVCQYKKGIRGKSEQIMNGPYAERFKEEISLSAELLNSGKSDITKELCRLCAFAKSSGLLDTLNANAHDDLYTKCTECPNKGHEIAKGELLTDVY